MRGFFAFSVLPWFCLLWIIGASASAADEKPPAVTTEVVLDGLSNPFGMALRPGKGELFVSDSAAGMIVSVDPAQPNKSTPVITGYNQDIYGKGPKYAIGPLGLAFLNADTLVVGDGSAAGGAEVVQLFKLPTDAAKLPLTADAPSQKLGPIAANPEVSTPGEGNFFGVAATPAAIFVTAQGDDAKGWILKADLNGSTAGQLKPFIKTKIETGVSTPLGITMSERGEVVVGQMGELDQPRDSQLTFYNPKDGKKLLSLPAHLHDITALAYSPKTKRLYALDFSGNDSQAGGLYRLDSAIENNQQVIKPLKITSLEKPTAMVFDPAGVLYVTVLGQGGNPEQANKQGKLLKIVGEL
ncbi:MAG: hypothetical protein SFX18_07550 [Pirellulales bacterium]|nr:hypothetical protein [Pirellulales bacterium]